MVFKDEYRGFIEAKFASYINDCCAKQVSFVHFFNIFRIFRDRFFYVSMEF